MIQKTFGEFICHSCGQVNINPKMMDIDENDDSKGSLIYCEFCDGWKKWVY